MASSGSAVLTDLDGSSFTVTQLSALGDLGAYYSKRWIERSQYRKRSKPRFSKICLCSPPIPSDCNKDVSDHGPRVCTQKLKLEEPFTVRSPHKMHDVPPFGDE